MPRRRHGSRLLDKNVEWGSSSEDDDDAPVRSSGRIRARKDLERLEALSRRRSSGRARRVQQPPTSLPSSSAAHQLHNDLAKHGMQLDEDEDEAEETIGDNACIVVQKPVPKARKRSKHNPREAPPISLKTDDPPQNILSKAKQQALFRKRRNYPRRVPEEYFSLGSSSSIRSEANTGALDIAQHSQRTEVYESSETEEEEPVFTNLKSEGKPRFVWSAPSNTVEKAHVETIQITVCFLRNEKSHLFEPAFPLSASEVFIQHAASLEPSMVSRYGRKPHRYREPTRHREVEDQFFSGIMQSDVAVTGLRAQIRRLLNVYFEHPEPERLEPSLRIYDENNHEAGCLYDSHGRRQAKDNIKLSSLAPSEPNKTGQTRQELLVVVHKIKRSNAFDFCPRSSWVNIKAPLDWTLSNQFRREGTTALRSKTFWQHAITTRRQRTVLDTVPTRILSRHPEKNPAYVALPRENPHATLYGVSIET